MFEVEGEMQGRVNIYEANVSANSLFSLLLTHIERIYVEYIKTDVWVMVML